MRLLHPSSCICNVIYKKRKGSTISCCREVKALLLNLSMPMPEGCASMLLSFVYERARRGGWMRVLSRMCFQWLQILNCLKISIYEVHLSTPILVVQRVSMQHPIRNNYNKSSSYCTLGPWRVGVLGSTPLVLC